MFQQIGLNADYSEQNQTVVSAREYHRTKSPMTETPMTKSQKAGMNVHVLLTLSGIPEPYIV